MNPAIVGLVGVVTGALVTGGVQAYAAWRLRRVAAKVAARLVNAALFEAEKQISASGRAQSWGTWVDVMPTWVEQRIALASALSADEFEQIAVTFMMIRDVGTCPC